MTEETRGLGITNQQELLREMKGVLNEIRRQKIDDQLAARVLVTFQSVIRLYNSYLAAQVSELQGYADDSAVSRLRAENLNLRQEKANEFTRNQELSGQLVALVQQEEFRKFIEEFWSGVKENPALAERVFGIELALGADPSKSQVMTKKIDFIIANFLDLTKVNENFNQDLTKYATLSNKETERAGILEGKLGEADKKIAVQARELEEAGKRLANVSGEAAQLAAELQGVRTAFDGERVQFENIKQDLQAEVQAYLAVYDAVFGMLPAGSEDQQDLRALIDSGDNDLPGLIKTLLEGALARKSELLLANARKECAERALKAIFEKNFEQYLGIADPEQARVWVIQTHYDSFVRPLEEARAEIASANAAAEKRLAELQDIQQGISQLAVLAKGEEGKEILASLLEEGSEAEALANPLGYIKEKLQYVSEQLNALKGQNADKGERIAELEHRVVSLGKDLEAATVKYEPPKPDVQALMQEGKVNKTLAAIYVRRQQALPAKVHFDVAIDKYKQALEQLPDAEKAPVAALLKECETASAGLGGVKNE